jgi:hypothetical protein
MITYQTSGVLTEPVSNFDVDIAQAYLSEHDMADFLPERLINVVVSVEWRLTGTSAWTVTAQSNVRLTSAELEALASWVSGQNSDGLGEGFEQQAFAEHGDHEDFTMSSFDWQTNPCTFIQV